MPINKPVSRRGFLACAAIAVMGGGCMSFAPASAFAADATTPKSASKKPLVVYFSHSGHTKELAEMIHKRVGGDIVQIEPVQKYPEQYNELTAFAKVEKEKGARPKIKTRIGNLDQYGIIFLGYPNWWSTMPMPVFTFVEENKLDGKTIAPFDTHGGGGLADSIDDLKKIAPHSRILKPLSVNGSRVSSAEKDVLKWLEGLGPALIETTTGNPAIYPDGAY